MHLSSEEKPKGLIFKKKKKDREHCRKKTKWKGQKGYHPWGLREGIIRKLCPGEEHRVDSVSCTVSRTVKDPGTVLGTRNTHDGTLWVTANSSGHHPCQSPSRKSAQWEVRSMETGEAEGLAATSWEGG